MAEHPKSRFIAEKEEIEPLFNPEYEGDVPLTAEELHKRHHEDMAKAKARTEEAARNIDYPEDEDIDYPDETTKPADASGDAARGKRG
jgi:hypothetical protein